MDAFGGYLYVGTTNDTTGGEVWRTPDGASWNQVNSDGFGSGENWELSSFAVFDGYLYIGMRNDSSGAQIWRSANGTSWSQVVGDGFGDTGNIKTESLFVYGGRLYGVTYNPETGAEVWRAADGATWKQVNVDGFGDSNNFATLWANATTVFGSQLYIGTWNIANGGEVWMMLHRMFLPLVLRSS
jgi:hypothetical protein